MGFLDNVVDVISLPVTLPLKLGEKIVDSGTKSAIKIGTAPAKIIGSNVKVLSSAAGQGLEVIGSGAGKGLQAGLTGVGKGVGAGLSGAVKPLGLNKLPNPLSGGNGGSDHTLMYVGLASGSIVVLGLFAVIVMKKKKTK